MNSEEYLSTRVIKIGDKWHCRLIGDEYIYDEMSCKTREDIGYCMGQMLRWYHKMGNSPFSKMADASRYRQSRRTAPIMKVYYIGRDNV